MPAAKYSEEFKSQVVCEHYHEHCSSKHATPSRYRRHYITR